DDGLAANGVATAGAIDEEIAVSADDDGVGVSAKDAADDTRNAAGEAVGGGLFLGFRHGLGAGGREFCQPLAGRVFAVADAGHQVVGTAESVFAGRSLQVGFLDFLQRDAVLARLFFDQLASDFNGALALVDFEPVLGRVGVAGKLDEGEPVAAGLVSGLGDDFDDVAGMKLVAEGNHASVDLGAGATVANLGVNGIGEVDGRGFARQDQDLALGREGVNLFRVEIDFQGGKEFVGIGDVALPLDDLAEPGKALLVLGGDGAVFIFPVGGDAFFAHLVHFFGADLDFKSLARLGDDGGVQRLVEVGPRHGDEVLDAAGHGAPEVVDDAENGVAILHRVGDDAHGVEVVDLVDRDMLALQFPVNAVEAFDAAFDAAGDAGFLEAVAEHAYDPRHESFTGFAAGLDGGADLLVSDGVEKFETEVFEFAANLAHAETVRDGGVNFERLAGDFLLALVIQMLEGAHVVEAVGELDEDDADVVDHGQHHFAEVLGLGLFPGGEIDLADLGDALDDVGNLFAEFLADFNGGDRGVFDRVVEQAGGDGNGIHLHVGENVADFERVHQVGLAGGAGLSGVVLLGEFVGFLDQFEGVVGTVLAQLPHQLAEAGDREHVGRNLLTQRRHDRF